MIFNLLKAKCDDAADTGTYADGAFEPPALEIKLAPRLRGHAAHERDYGNNRTVVPIPAGFA
ncbi:hypothetical protein OIU34_11490 [Pararhizobium sp. BT-229]|uniref:hypothetical protein n=1 Tax=Pararhizobium sp. BT-229 TaxID=2986923 RepID=UPI0021F6DC03|nr:hypothetical protein [Pararhizobium sp. BT-229]MCV9962523.1 hypothetical protein [Pararhizobium sp. BT-229]